MPKLAVILSGGVSLGSFQAGVLSELLHALDVWNHKHVGKPGSRYQIDVITGSSAGALSAVLVARAILHDPKRYRDRMFSAWVREINARDLIRNMPDPPYSAILSREPIEQIARDALGPPYETAGAASYAPETLRLAFTASNMDGLDRRLPILEAEGRPLDEQGHAFYWTSYADILRFTVSRRTRPEEAGALWKRIGDAAIASASFPLAFPPKTLDRVPGDYPDWAGAVPFPGEFTYVDGGMFNNEPIREAVRLATVADGGKLAEDRRFLLIDPFLNGSKYRDIAATNEAESLRKNAQRVVQMIFDQARAIDLKDLDPGITLSMFNADARMTAGDQLQAFAGFLEEGWRRQNFRYGRTLARENLGRMFDEAEYHGEAGLEGDQSYLDPGEVEAILRRPKPSTFVEILGGLTDGSKDALIEGVRKRCDRLVDVVGADLFDQLILLAARQAKLPALDSRLLKTLRKVNPQPFEKFKEGVLDVIEAKLRDVLKVPVRPPEG